MILILGGTSEASALARLIAARPDITALVSLAGATARPSLPPIPHRVGGFGGADGLAAFLRDNCTEAVVDATHPFAERISANAAEACRITGTPLLALRRPPTRTSAASTTARAAGDRPARPSSPMPTMDSQRPGWLMVATSSRRAS